MCLSPTGFRVSYTILPMAREVYGEDYFTSPVDHHYQLWEAAPTGPASPNHLVVALSTAVLYPQRLDFSVGLSARWRPSQGVVTRVCRDQLIEVA